MNRKIINVLVIGVIAILLSGCESNYKKEDTAKSQVTTQQSEGNNTQKNNKVEKNNNNVEQKNKVDNTSKKSNNSDNIIKNNTAEQQKVKENDNSKNKSAALNKNKYLIKLNNINKELESKDVGTTTLEMRQHEDEAYKLWDNALNDIYNALKENLPHDEFKKLEKEEMAWIKQKEEKAKNESEQFKGGTMESLQKISVMAQETKKRCYELVTKYMR